MRAIFQSKFPDLEIIKKIAIENAKMINIGADLYIDFMYKMDEIKNIKNKKYISISDIYDKLNILPFQSFSKRKFYEKYDSGIIIGAGSGEDCIDLIDNCNWGLFDLTDDRMINKAIGYCNGKGLFNKTGTRDGDTVTSVRNKYNKGKDKIEFVTIDSLLITKLELISADVEGSALDVLAGAIKTINLFKPDLFISIYHNYIEYLLIIPFLYDLGYEINVCVTPNFTPQQPHLELTLYCKPTEVKS